jgi:hypothetical protein
MVYTEQKKKSDLKILRQEKLRGCYIRSKLQWAEEEEKPSIFTFFLNLETIFLQIRLFLNLLMNLKNVITDQNQLLQEAKTYYENLYSKRVNRISTQEELRKYRKCSLFNDEREKTRAKF